MSTFHDNTITVQIMNPKRDGAEDLKITSDSETEVICLSDVDYSVLPIISPEKKCDTVVENMRFLPTYENEKTVNNYEPNRVYVLKDSTFSAYNLSKKSYYSRNDNEICPRDLSMKKIIHKNSTESISEKKLLSNFTCYKCKNCMFITCLQEHIETHRKQKHLNEIEKTRKQLHCPGCKNVFVSKKSLKAHLIHDHQVLISDLKLFLKYVTNDSHKTQKVINKKFKKTDRKLKPTTVTCNSNVDFMNYMKVLPKNVIEISDFTNNASLLKKSEPTYVDHIENGGDTSTNSFSTDQELITNITTTADSISAPVQTDTMLNKDIVLTNYTNVNYNNHSKLPTILITDINLNGINIAETTTTPTVKNIKSEIIIEENQTLNPIINKVPKKTKVTKLKNDSKIQSSAMQNKQLEKEPKVFKCSTVNCNVRMKSSSNLEYHIKCHNIEKSDYLCPECPTTFNHWNSLRGHLWRKHKIDMEMYSCDMCDYKTFSLSQLNNIHKRIHSDIKPFLCDICAKAFKNPKQLRTHKSIHKPVYRMCKFVCEMCNRPFASRRLLKLHVEGVHHQLKRFFCKYCSYKANSKSSVQLHERKHTGQKPYTCELCEYATADHNSLRRHKLKHNGEYSYRCPYCNYACIQSSTFKIHLKNKHPNIEHAITFSCKYCNFKSLRKDNYLTHIAKHNIPTNITSNDIVSSQYPQISEVRSLHSAYITETVPSSSTTLSLVESDENTKSHHIIEDPLQYHSPTNDSIILTRNKNTLDNTLDLYTIPILINSSNKNVFYQNGCLEDETTVMNDEIKVRNQNNHTSHKQEISTAAALKHSNSKFVFVSTNDFTANNMETNTFVLDSNLVTNTSTATQSFLVQNLTNLNHHNSGTTTGILPLCEKQIIDEKNIL